MAVASAGEVRSELGRLAHRGCELRELAPRIARVLNRAIPLDGVCLLTMDPSTLLPTGEVVYNGLPDDVMPRLVDIELAGTDFNAFATLVRTNVRAASLSRVTAGDLERSVRHRELRRPNGLGDELRAVLRSGRATWGGLTVLRTTERAHFTVRETALVGSLASYLAAVVRRSLVFAAAASTEHDESPGVILVGPDRTPTQISRSARRLLAELAGDTGAVRLPAVVTAVAARARDIAAGHAGAEPSASARVRTPAGRWLVVRGMVLDEDESLAAVLIEPARPYELAPVIADAYGLTSRELEVTQLVARGLPTDAIGQTLSISPWTAQDHLKSIFDKVGVGNRGELIARVFFEPRPPNLATLADDG